MLLFGRPAEVGPVGGGRQLRDGDPPAGPDDHAAERGEQLPEPAPQPGRARPQVGEPEPGQHEERLEHLGEEREAEQHARRSTSQRVRSRSIARCTQYPAAVISSTSSASGLLNRNISAADRGQREHGAGDQPGRRPEPAAHRGVQQQHRQHALERLRGEQRPRAEPEDPRRTISSTHSEAGVLSTVMKLDESNEPKKNAFQDLRARLHRGGVEVVGVAVPAQVPQVEQRGDGEQAEQGRPRPLRVGCGPRQQAAQPALAADRAAGGLER